MKKKIINGILLVAMLFAATSAFVSCKDTDADYKSETDAKIAALQAQLDNLRGQVGPQGPQGPQGPAGKDGQNGQDGKDGQNGENGLTPFIGDNGNWWIGTTDTGVAAKGQDGQNGQDGKDGQNGKDGQDGKDGLTPFIGDNGNWWIGTKDTGVSAKGTSGEGTDFTEQIEALQKAINDLKKLIWGSEDAFNKALVDEKLASIQEQINALSERIAAVYTTEVTSLSADQVVNPMFTFNAPFDVKANILLAYFGEKAKRDIYFPRGAEEPIVWKGDYIIEGNGNAGKLYVTVNPSSVDFSGKTLKLMTTGGDESPVELTPLEASTKNLMFLSRGENAFYETYATIPAEKIAKAYVSWEPEDMEGFKDQIKEILNRSDRNKEQLINLFNTIYNLIIQNNIPAYRLQAAWGEGNYTYSEANIAAVAIKPLTFAFDLETEAQYDGDAITALEKLEGKVVKIVSKSESTRAHIWNFLNNVNPYADKVFRNINWAIQPTLLISDGNEISHPDVYSVNTSATINRYMAGEIKLLPTSWTAEILAPAFKKYVAVVEVDGVEVSADDPVNAGLLGKVIPGSVNEIPFTVEAGKTYKIQYSAVDYGGNIRNLYYYIRGFKNN